MTAFGVALPECVNPERDTLLRALDEFAARSAMPDVLPVWCREWQVDPTLLAGINQRGVMPICYVETRHPVIPVDTLLRFADDVGEGVYRLNQEPDGDWGAEWQDWEPRTYAAHWGGSQAIMPSNLLGFWCPSRPKRAVEAGYWPEVPDIVGMDGYAWDEDDDLVQRFRNGVRQYRDIAPGSPVWIGETGIGQEVPHRSRRMRDLATLEGIEVIIFMNLVADAPDGERHDWTWNAAMERAFKDMAA